MRPTSVTVAAELLQLQLKTSKRERASYTHTHSIIQTTVRLIGDVRSSTYSGICISCTLPHLWSGDLWSTSELAHVHAIYIGRVK